jgi:hypothetical protein
MCSGKRQGRAKLRQNVAGLAKNQDEVYENYEIPRGGYRPKPVGTLGQSRPPSSTRKARVKPHLHPGWNVYLAKPKRKRRAPEAAFQCQVAEYLSKALPEGYWFTAFPAGGGGRIRGAQLKRMGLKAGVPDMVVFKEDCWPHAWVPVLWLELKAKAGSLSHAQKQVHAQLETLGHKVETVKTLEQVQTALAEFVFPEVLKVKVI